MNSAAATKVTSNEFGGSHETEGRTSTDGTNVIVTIRNIGGPQGEKFSLEGRFAHEFEHARQFEDGEISFVKSAKGEWGPNPRDYDIYDEVNAFKAQLGVSAPIQDTGMLRSLRDDRSSDDDRAQTLVTNGYKNRVEHRVNTSFPKFKSGELVRPTQVPGYFGRNHP
jgi:hypothetical protein